MAASEAQRGAGRNEVAGEAAGRWRRVWPAWLLLAIIAALLAQNLAALGWRALRGAGNAREMAPLFSPPVQRWRASLTAWSREHELPVNLLATVMQLESCGRVDAISPAGALGLFQVMPFHFAADEEPLTPAANARRAANFLNECLRYGGGDITLALACYNGGPALTARDFADWPRETQLYSRWGAAIYRDAARGRSRSSALDDWWQAGGNRLCAQAAAAN